MTWGIARDKKVDLATLRDIHPTDQEQHIYDGWDQLDAMVW